MQFSSSRPGAVLAIGAAALLGASIPASKWLLGGGVDPQLLAGLFYLGSGVGLGCMQLLRRAPRESDEAPLRRRDWPRLGTAVLVGGGLAPVLLMWGVKASSASSASLLLNLESVATMLARD